MKEERKPCLHTLMWFYGQSERAHYLNYFIISCGSPYIFTKVVGFLVKFWRSCDRLNVLFSDDEIGGPAVYKSCSQFSRPCQSDLALWGFALTNKNLAGSPLNPEFGLVIS